MIPLWTDLPQISIICRELAKCGRKKGWIERCKCLTSDCVNVSNYKWQILLIYIGFGKNLLIDITIAILKTTAAYNVVVTLVNG